ncbi:MAG: hypothetical protein ABIQ89_04545 [Candidatus Saccharimonadales bacterium]
MVKSTNIETSPLRLRIGISLIVIWWLPFWALAPFIANLFTASTNDHLTATITSVIIVLQTLVGFIGAYVAGSQVKAILKNSSKQHALAKVWQVFRHGKVAL